MKKKLFGAVLFLLLMPLAVSADSFVGKTIEGTFPLYIDGQRVTQDVIVVDGISFIPVRAASELFGYEVDFDETTRTVLLNKQQAEETQIQTQDSGDDEMNKERIQGWIEQLEGEILSIEASITAHQYLINKLEEKGELSTDDQKKIQEYQTKIDELQSKLEELKRQKAELEEQLKQFK